MCHSNIHFQARHVLMAYPGIPGMTYWSFSQALKFLEKQSAFPPLGLAAIAAFLPEDCVIRLIDLNVEPLTDERLQWADVVMISAMIVQKDSFAHIVRRANRLGKPVIAGGPYPSTAYEEIVGVDCFVIGEAEALIRLCWKDFINGSLKRAYARPTREADYAKLVSFFGSGADIQFSPSFLDMNETRVPRFDLLKLKAYQSMSVQASRGCPIGCEFCDIWRRFGRRPRVKPEDMLVQELDELYRLGWRGPVFIVDDNFIGNRNRAKALLDALAVWQSDRGHPFEFFTECTVTLADDDELLKRFPLAGVQMVFVGIETPSEECLKETRKRINARGAIAGRVARIQKAGVIVASGFIIGFDNDPEDIGDLMIEFIQGLGIPVAMVGLLQALPDTDLHERLEREGRLLKTASGNNTHVFETNFVTLRPAAKVSSDYGRVLRHIYSPSLRSYFDRCATLRGHWKKPARKGKLSWHQLKVFFRYIATVPFHSYRWNAWRFLAATALKKPSFFVHAVSLGVQGHHFREITRNSLEAVRLKSLLAEKRAEFSGQLLECLKRSSASRQRRLKEFRAFRDRTLEDARKRFYRLNRDVREMIGEEYERFQCEIDELYRQWEASMA